MVHRRPGCTLERPSDYMDVYDRRFLSYCELDVPHVLFSKVLDVRHSVHGDADAEFPVNWTDIPEVDIESTRVHRTAWRRKVDWLYREDAHRHFHRCRPYISSGLLDDSKVCIPLQRHQVVLGFPDDWIYPSENIKGTSNLSVPFYFSG